MRLLILSDLHIGDMSDPFYPSLLNLIRFRTERGDILIFAGDLFDLFVGNKKIFQDEYIDFFHAVADASQRGVQIHYIEGNHDFLLHDTFRTIPNVKVHPVFCPLEQAGKKFYITHGDTVDHSDYGYRFLRWFLRTLAVKLFIQLVPGQWLDQLGHWSSRHSRSRRKKTPLLAHELPLERREQLRILYRNYAADRLMEGYDFVVMGHCHDLDEMCFTLAGRSGQYVNIGFPRVHGSFLSWSPGDHKIQRERL